MELEEGEVVCNECNGKGVTLEWIELNYLAGYKSPKEKECDKCLGAGKLDWIENVVGKRPQYDFVFHSHYGISLIDHHIGSVFSNCYS